MYTRIPYTAHMIGKVIYTSSLHQSVRLWMIYMLTLCRKNCTKAFCDGSNCLDSFALDGAVRHGHVAPWSSTKANSGRNRWLHRWRVLKENKDSTFPNAWSETDIICNIYLYTGYDNVDWPRENFHTFFAPSCLWVRRASRLNPPQWDWFMPRYHHSH